MLTLGALVADPAGAATIGTALWAYEARLELLQAQIGDDQRVIEPPRRVRE